jgi:hypothetical protein
LTPKKEAQVRLAFQITDKEIQSISQKDTSEALVSLVIERVALLATQF